MALPISRSDREYKKFRDLSGKTAVASSLEDKSGGVIDVQNPLSTDGDGVYAKDLIMDLSNPSNFIITGNPTATDEEILTSMVSNVEIEKKNDTTDNPKSITLTFKRPVVTSSFGIDSGPNGDFSNTKITIFQGQASEVIIDESTDNTKHLIRLFPTPPIKFSKILIEFHTTDTITTGLIGIFKSIEVTSRLQAVSTLTGNVEDISSYRETLNVNNAWAHRKIVNETYHQHTGNITNPTTGINEGDISVTVDDASGFSIGDKAKISEGELQEIGILTITNVVGSVITFDRPIGNIYTTAALIEEVITNMAVNGSLASPVIFEIDPPIGTVWQITRILFSIVDNVTPDDGRFGGIVALTNGVSLRATTAAGRTVVFANWKTNGDMKLDMFDVTYTDRAPSGNFGVNGRWTFTTAEVIAELDGDASPVQKLEILIQDDLTDLIDFKMRGQGRVESP